MTISSLIAKKNREKIHIEATVIVPEKTAQPLFTIKNYQPRAAVAASFWSGNDTRCINGNACLFTTGEVVAYTQAPMKYVYITLDYYLD